MALLRYLAVVVLSVWVGGLAVLGVAAPVLFAALEGHDPSGGRELAGLAFGAVFRHFQTIAWVCAGALLALLGVRAALGPRPRRLAARLWTVLAMLVISIGTTVAIIPTIDQMRRDARGSIAALPDGDPTKTQFGRLHGLSNGLMLITLAGGLGLLWFESTDTH